MLINKYLRIRKYLFRFLSIVLKSSGIPTLINLNFVNFGKVYPNVITNILNILSKLIKFVKYFINSRKLFNCT